MPRLAQRLVLLAAHSLRLAVVAAIAWIVHGEHAAFLGRQQGADLATVPIDRIRRHLPEATTIGGDAEAVAGGRHVLAASGDRVGTIFKTSQIGRAHV